MKKNVMLLSCAALLALALAGCAQSTAQADYIGTDAAKAIALGAAEPEADLWDFWLGKRPVERTLPVGAVLTISAAGSETSSSAVLTRDDTLEKRGLTSEQIRPRFAVMDPELTCSLPPTRSPAAWWIS